MKFSLPIIIIAILGALFFVVLAIPNVRSTFDSNPDSFPKYLKTSLPPSALVTNLAASTTTAGDGCSLRLQAKIKLSHPDFISLAAQMGLSQNEAGHVNPSFEFKEQDSGIWWNPPFFSDRTKPSDRYRKIEQGPYLSLGITMIWIEGTAYLEKKQFVGYTGLSPKTSKSRP